MIIHVYLYSCFSLARPIREGESRKKLPNLVISGLSDKQLRKKLKEYGLSSKGDKKVWTHYSS